jgi:hypothetical protein
MVDLGFTVYVSHHVIQDLFIKYSVHGKQALPRPCLVTELAGSAGAGWLQKDTE